MGSRKTGEGFDKVYAAASAWVERALKADDSLFDPGKSIWTAAGLQQLRERFLDRPDYGSGNFYDKLRQQQRLLLNGETVRIGQVDGLCQVRASSS